MSPDRTPVIAGVGEITDRPKDVAASLEPIDLMAEAARRADTHGLLKSVDSIDIVGLVSWRYEDTPALLNARLGIAPKRSVYGPVGGESPVRYLHQAALRIARGESDIGMALGAEAQYAVGHAKRAGIELPWTPYAVNAPRFQRAADYVHPLAVKLGVAMPVSVYPFYEAATAHAWGQTPGEAQEESGELWARYSQAAARNPYSWLPKALAPADITKPAPDNRMIAWPYTKRQVANPNVNQGAAVILTSLARARAAGIAEDDLVFVGAGASANEPRDWLARDTYTESHAQTAVLEALSMQTPGGFDAMELYSCFPVVPKMARRTLGLGADVQPSVSGGLSFFGAPLNNHMTHAACAMVRAIRGNTGMRGAERGLIYGQGEFVTKHHALILGRAPMEGVLAGGNAQAIADARRGAVPPTDEAPDGEGAIETFTVLYDPAGQPAYGAVIVRMDSGARTLARAPHPDDIALLQDMERFPIGVRGRVRLGAGGLPEWRAQN